MATTDECLCGQGMNNTGLPSCIKLFKKVTGIFIVPLFANDGTRNSFSLASANDITAKVQHTDPSKRWYPVQDLKDVELPTAESRFETAKDGSKFKLADGIKSFKATAFEQGSVLAGKLQGVSCGKFGVYLFDIDGNMRGIKDGSVLYPVEIGGWDAIFQDATDDNVSKIMIQFDFDILLKVSKFWLVSSSDTVVNPNTVSGLVDANITEVSSTTTVTTITVYSDYGSGLTDQAVTGLVTADFSAYNDTDSASVSVTVAEDANIDGKYTVTYTSQTVADLLTINILPASGYEGSIQVTI